MFSGCSSLKELNLNNFNTNKVINMEGMFAQCSSLIELNISNFNTNNVKDMSHMFYRCKSLKKLNISNFNNNNLYLNYNFKRHHFLYFCIDFLFSFLILHHIHRT